MGASNGGGTCTGGCNDGNIGCGSSDGDSFGDSNDGCNGSSEGT